MKNEGKQDNAIEPIIHVYYAKQMVGTIYSVYLKRQLFRKIRL